MNTIYQEILESYRLEQEKHKAERKHRKALLYEKYPRFAQIDLKMSQISAQISKTVLKAPNNTEELLRQLKIELDDLKSEKSVLMTDLNIPVDYLDIQYTCNKCKDTGFIDQNKRCSCFKQKLISRAYAMSGIEKLLEKQNFSNFNLNVFSSDILPKEQLTQRDNMKKILSETESFVSTFPNGRNLFFYGSSGLGKTYLCNCIAKTFRSRVFCNLSNAF